MRKIDLTGHTYNQWTVISPSAPVKKRTMWLCRCTCGKTATVEAYKLKTGHSKSCGCTMYLTEKFLKKRHGLSYHPLYPVYSTMKARCLNPTSQRFNYYGQLGVTVCDKWRFGDGNLTGFECFLADLGERPSPKHSIDRIDPTGNYEPNNCRWATMDVQRANRRKAFEEAGEIVNLD